MAELSALARRLMLYDEPQTPDSNPNQTTNNLAIYDPSTWVTPTPIQLNPSATPASQLPNMYGTAPNYGAPPPTNELTVYDPSYSTTGGARPGNELLRPAADSAAQNLGSYSDPLSSILAPPQVPQTDLSGLLAALQGGPGGADAISSRSDQFLSALINQLGPAPQMPQMDVNKMAADQIQLQYGQQEQAIRNAMQELANQSAMNQQTQSTYGANADTALQGIYDALRNDLYRNQGQVANVYGQTQGSVRNSYDEASDALTGLKNSVVGQLGGTADQLGIQQGMGSPLARILSNFSTMQGGNLQNKATSLAGLGRDQANQLALGDRQISGAESQGATARKDLALGVQQALAQLALQSQTQQGGLESQLTGLEVQKPADYRTNVNNLNQMLYNMQRQSRLDQLGEMVQLGTLQQGQENIDLKAQQGQSSNALGIAQLALQQQKLNQEYALATDPLKRAQIAQQMDLLNSQSQYYQSRAGYYDAGGAAGTANKGTHGDLLEQFLDAPQPGLWGDTGAGPQFRSGILGVINDAGQQAKLMGGDPYAIALAQLATQPGNLDMNGLRAALQRYFKGS